MKCAAIIAAGLTLAGCSASKESVREQMHCEQVRVDSLAALLTDDSQVQIHDIVIFHPADTPRVKAVIGRVELSRKREAQVNARSEEQTQCEAETQQSREAKPHSSRRLALPVLLLLLALLLRWICSRK